MRNGDNDDEMVSYSFLFSVINNNGDNQPRDSSQWDFSTWSMFERRAERSGIAWSNLIGQEHVSDGQVWLLMIEQQPLSYSVAIN